MSENYLGVTFRRGRPLAAYYYLPRRPGDRSIATRRVEPGMVIDLARGGRPIGIEMMNRVLWELGQPTLRRVDLSPLLAA